MDSKQKDLKTISGNTDLEDLSSKDPVTVKKRINFLIKNKKNSQELISLFTKRKNPEDFSALWAVVVLGESKCQEAIDPLIESYKTPNGLLAVAVYDALLNLSSKDPKAIFEKIKSFFSDYFQTFEKLSDQKQLGDIEATYQDRIYLYDVLGRLQPNKSIANSVKQYLMEAIEKDYLVNGRIALNLLRWPLEKGMASFFERQMELALVARRGIGQNNRQYVEARWALINYSKGAFGEKNPYIHEDKIFPWEKRWEPIFKLWQEKIKQNKNPKQVDNEKKKKPEIKKSMSEVQKEKEHLKKQQTEVKEFNLFKAPSFNINEYLKVSPVKDREKKLYEDIKLINEIPQAWDIKSVQEKLSQSKDFYTALDFFIKEFKIVKEEKDKNQEERLKKFAEILYDLWLSTPQTAWAGLTPTEKSIYDKYGQKPGRNEPCPCGALNENGMPVKYKKCCERKFV
jgi:hypothetical protein